MRRGPSALLISLLVASSSGISGADDAVEIAGPIPAVATLVANITIDATKTGPAISPGLFGQNGAVWMSMNDTIAKLTNESGVTILRWPGGETTDYYDWEADGGNGRVYRDDGTYWSPIYNTDTFIDFCRKTSCAPMISANAVIADPQKAARWARYFANNSLPVKLWQVGNEPLFDKHWNISLPNFKANDNFQPTTDEWAWTTREYAKALRAVDPDIKIIGPDGGAAEGSRDDVWVGEFTRKARDVIDYVDIHSYPANGMNEADMLATPDSGPDGGLVSRIRKAQAMILGNASGRRLPLTMTEYNSDWNNGPLMGSWVNGLYIADVLLHLAEENVTIANMWNLASQNEGYIDPNGEPRSSWWAFKMLRERFSGTVVEATSDAVANGYGLEAYASSRPDGSLAIAVINKKSAISYDATISISGFKPGNSAEVRLLDHQHNDSREADTPVNGSSIRHTFLPYSLTLLLVNASLPPPLTVKASAVPPAGVVPLKVQFNSTVSGAQGAVAWDWRFGDGGAAQSQNATHTYSAPGAYNATVTVKDAAGRNASDTVQVSVAPPPPQLLVSASASPTLGVAPLTVNFSASASGAIGQVQFTWKFGDGSTASGAFPSHIYSEEGPYDAEVTARDAGSRNATDSVRITVLYDDSMPPPPPLDLRGVYEGDDVKLTWRLGGPPGFTFNVYRENATTWNRLNSAAVATTEYRDRTVTPGRSYTYRVTSVDSAGRESSPSGAVTVPVPAAHAEPPPFVSPAVLVGLALLVAVLIGAAAALAVHRKRRRRRNGLYQEENRGP